MDRRQFLKKSGIILAASALPIPKLIYASTAFGEEKWNAPKESYGTLMIAGGNKMSLLNIANGKVEHFDLPNTKSHYFELFYGKKIRAVVIDQDEEIASIWDLNKKKIESVVHANNGQLFSGHGVFSPDGTLFYLPEFPRNKKDQGAVRVLETKNWKEVKKFQSQGAQTHFVQNLNAGKNIAIGHYGKIQNAAPNIDGILSVLDAESGKVETIIKPKIKHSSYCHFEANEDDSSIVVSTRAWYKNKEIKNPKIGFLGDVNLSTPIAIAGLQNNSTHEMMPKSIENKMRLNLTIKLDKENHISFVSHTAGSAVSFWDMKEKKLKSLYETPGDYPLGLGLCLSDKYYLIATYYGKLHFIDKKTFKSTHIANMGVLGINPAPHFSILSKEII
ncbi:MAG: DUF1513 domain-containing protein [Oligoflexia bacterium]|nr:DUF1513 domain-containing protein [Oligoflexia bacterium]